MAKQKTVYFCSQCGHESSKWMGQCPACKQWNTFTEEKVTETKKGGAKSLKPSASSGIQSQEDKQQDGESPQRRASIAKERQWNTNHRS